MGSSIAAASSFASIATVTASRGCLALVVVDYRSWFYFLLLRKAATTFPSFPRSILGAVMLIFAAGLAGAKVAVWKSIGKRIMTLKTRPELTSLRY